ncbi:unnamed protein product [Cuscuta epithymum]|uniref:Uncharacterized protein n=1 Tax=Cuscuta epithymum TaxID=186058 RepID=A0AAV0F7F2_9ASTE|nr:unnamed protein product [Cuscuta epithymum]
MQTWRTLISSLKIRSAAPPSILKRRFHSTSYRSDRQRDASLLSAQHPSSASSSWRFYILPGALFGGVGGLILFLHNNDERRAIPKGQGVKFERSSNQGPIIGGPFSLLNTEGKLVTEQKFLGNWVLLYFGYTSSPEIGPAVVRKMATTVDLLVRSKPDLKVLPVFVTIDPQRDTPSQLRFYLEEFDPRIVGLTGPASAIRQITQEYRVFIKRVDEEEDDYLIETSDNLYLLNPKMEVVRCFGGEYYNAELLADEIDRVVRKSGV